MENQNIEYKIIWKDEYLKWICGMANADGGIMYIGKDDTGKVVGVDNAVILVKEIPNKIKDTMGIIPNVCIEEENNLLYIKIKIEKYPLLIMYKGRVYVRSGSNNNEITGRELERVILEKMGKRWEMLPVKEASFDDLSDVALKTFRKKAVRSGRLTTEEASVDDGTLLRNLGLYDGKFLNNAAILLFGENPDRWIGGSYIKIGVFEKSVLKHQQIISGPLILQMDEVMHSMYAYHLHGLIYYEGIERREEYLITSTSFREIILNSIVHKQYEESNSIQISIYEDKLYVWNDAKFPDGFSSENIYEKHYSKPYNPLIAQAFFKAGFIESWGLGFENIKKESMERNIPLPQIEINSTGVMVKCFASERYKDILKDMNNYMMVREDSIEYNRYGIKLTDVQRDILENLQRVPFLKNEALASFVGIPKHDIEHNLRFLEENELIRRVGSELRGHWEILI